MIRPFRVSGVPRILFGPGEFGRLDRITKEQGDPVLIVTGAVSLERSGKWDELADSLDELRIYQETFCKEGKKPIVVCLTNIKTVSKESRDIYSSDEMGSIISAAALLVGNPVSRIMGNFYMGINKTKMPVRMFTSTGSAKTWLRDFLPR